MPALSLPAYIEAAKWPQSSDPGLGKSLLEPGRYWQVTGAAAEEDAAKRNRGGTDMFQPRSEREGTGVANFNITYAQGRASLSRHCSKAANSWHRDEEDKPTSRKMKQKKGFKTSLCLTPVEREAESQFNRKERDPANEEIFRFTSTAKHHQDTHWKNEIRACWGDESQKREHHPRNFLSSPRSRAEGLVGDTNGHVLEVATGNGIPSYPQVLAQAQRTQHSHLLPTGCAPWQNDCGYGRRRGVGTTSKVATSDYWRMKRERKKE
ncbi:hypothetical protein FB45DRAFT_873157 [Roridomyces roridus]|uniref:Uncharacterized protein n=1 Tax=Roridomyces roridus TaxID=1738132 RepID=A0AAD7BAT6_9AGAR|nr:hypothetical protein FB45DRAFT_873157 [Roridomyces roridus]